MTVNAEPAAVPARGSKRGRALKLGVGVAISVAFLWATLSAVDFDAVGATLAQARPEWLAASLGFVLIAYLLKIYRWAAMLRSLGATIGFGQAAVPFMGGVALNNILPFRAGDVIRVTAFQRFTGVPPSGQLGTLLLERLLDLFVVMGILFVSITAWDTDALDPTLLSSIRLAALAVVVGILVFIAAPAPIRFVVRWAEARLPRLRAVGEALLRLSDAVSALSRPLFLLRITALSILVWLAEGGAFYAVGQALGIAPSVEATLIALSVGTLSTIIPSSPGYVGTFHFFTAKVVAAFGASQSGAAAYAILIHALLWTSTTVAGFLLLAMSGLRGRRSAPLARTAD